MSRRRRRILGGFGGSVINKQDRNIASGVRGPGIGVGAISNGTNTTQNLRSAHFNESGVSLTAVKVIYCGWYTDLVNETANANAYTVTASIEYPAATFTQVTWDTGSTSKSIGTGLNVLSDSIAVAIPAGAQFWVRTFVSVTSGQTWPLCGTLSSTLGELGEFAVGGSDKTMGGTIVGTSSCMRPAAIISDWKTGMKQSFAGVGDSNIFGSGDGFYDSNGNTGYVGRAATGNVPYLPIAVGGTTLASQVLANKLNYRLDLLTKAGITRILTDFGGGPTDTGLGYSTMIANVQTLWAALKTVPDAKVYQATVGPRSTVSGGTLGWFKNSTQTVASGFSGGAAAVGNQFNAFIRASSLISGYFDYSDLMSTARDSGIWRNGNEQPDAALFTPETLTVSGSPTTTSVPTNSVRATQYYLTGNVYWLTGVLAGTTTTSGVSNTTSTLTFSSALASAPSAGDTCIAYPAGCRATADGVHPQIVFPIGGGIVSGHILLRDAFIPVLQGWTA